MTARMSRGRLLLMLSILAVGLLSIFLVSGSPVTIIPGDPAEYRVRVEAMLNGGLPYLDVPFEHLPVMIIPMFGAWFLGGSASQSMYVFAFAGLMLVTTIATAPVMDSWGHRIGLPATGWRWAMVMVPLMPLALFRNDPVPVLLSVVALLMLVSERRSWVVFAMGGAWAKIWPAAISLAAWRRGKPATAVVVGLSGAAALALTFLPGFSAARRGVGIHGETVVGALVGLSRTARGDPSGVEITTAAYLPVSGLLVAVNTALGLMVLALAFWALRRSTQWRTASLAIGAAVGGVMLSSQLFSLQYVLWLMPFVALSRRRCVLMTAMALGLLTTRLAWVWEPTLFEDPLFYSMITVRNLAVVLIAWWLAEESNTLAKDSSVAGIS